MSRSRKQTAALGLLLTMSSVLPEKAKAGDATRVLRLQVREYVGLPEGALALAREQVDRIFREIGVLPVWVDFEDCGESPDVSSCRPWIPILILPRLSHVRDTSVMGLARAEAGRRPKAYVFYDHLRYLVERHTPDHQRRLAIAVVLGNVIAHELGHLLLRSARDHSLVGIMRAGWTSSQIRDARSGLLGFTEEQACWIRTELDGRLQLHRLD